MRANVWLWILELRDIVSGLAERSQEAMKRKQYGGAAELLGWMDRLVCIDNPVVERLLADAKHQVGGPRRHSVNNTTSHHLNRKLHRSVPLTDHTSYSHRQTPSNRPLL